MTYSPSHTNAWLSRFATSGLLIGQAALLTPVLQVLSVESAIAQPESANPSVTQPAPTSKQCNWAIAKSTIQQPAKETVNWQALLREAETLVAAVQEPIQMALQSQPLITDTDVAIGGDTAIAEKCWTNF